MKIGASFSHRHLEYLGLNPMTSLIEFRNLGLKWIRIGCYWDEIEKKEGVFTFEKTDELIKYCEAEKISMVITVGMKAPRYPEYYFPAWLKEKLNFSRLTNINNQYLLSKTIKLINKIVNRYKQYKYIKVWQIENEPMDPSGEKWLRISKEFLRKEVQAVRSLDNKRKILVNLWGNELTKRKVYLSAMELGDIVGIDLYFKHPIQINFLATLFKKYFGPVDSDSKIAEISSTIRRNHDFWITELQAEPWEANELVSKSKTPPSFLPTDFKINIERAKKFNPSIVLLWGFEYWLWKKLNGDSRYWDEIEKYINQNNLSK